MPPQQKGKKRAVQQLTSASDLCEDGLRESTRRPRGEAGIGIGGPPLSLCASGLSTLGGDLRGDGLLRGGLRRAGEALQQKAHLQPHNK